MGPRSSAECFIFAVGIHCCWNNNLHCLLSLWQLFCFSQIQCIPRINAQDSCSVVAGCWVILPISFRVTSLILVYDCSKCLWINSKNKNIKIIQIFYKKNSTVEPTLVDMTKAIQSTIELWAYYLIYYYIYFSEKNQSCLLLFHFGKSISRQDYLYHIVLVRSTGFKFPIYIPVVTEVPHQ